MPRRKRDDRAKTLPTIWRVSDELWAKIEPILAEHDPSQGTGRKRIDQRRALGGIIYRLRSGVQWNQLPEEFGVDKLRFTTRVRRIATCPDDSSAHRTFQRWVEREVFERIWGVLVPQVPSTTPFEIVSKILDVREEAHGIPT